jgi:hypothetical protein
VWLPEHKFPRQLGGRPLRGCFSRAGFGRSDRITLSFRGSLVGVIARAARSQIGPSASALVRGAFPGDDGIRTRDLHLGKKIAWRMSHASPPLSPVPLSCAFLALLSHPSHQIAGVDSISLIISLVLSQARRRRRRRPADDEFLIRRSPRRGANCGTHHGLDSPNVVNPSCYAFAQVSASGPTGSFRRDTAGPTDPGPRVGGVAASSRASAPDPVGRRVPVVRPRPTAAPGRPDTRIGGGRAGGKKCKCLGSLELPWSRRAR